MTTNPRELVIELCKICSAIIEIYPTWKIVFHSYMWEELVFSQCVIILEHLYLHSGFVICHDIQTILKYRYTILALKYLSSLYEPINVLCSNHLAHKSNNYWFSALHSSRGFVLPPLLPIHSCRSLVWRLPPLRIKSKGLVKYRYLTISKGIQSDSVRNAGYVRYCSPIRTNALCCQGDCL